MAARNYPGGNVTIKGTDVVDAMKRQNIINAIETKLDTDELEKLSQMITDKGRKTLKNKWSLIKKFL